MSHMPAHENRPSALTPEELFPSFLEVSNGKSAVVTCFGTVELSGRYNEDMRGRQIGTKKWRKRMGRLIATVESLAKEASSRGEELTKF